MATDIWNGNGNWTGDPKDWGLGRTPLAGDYAEIATGTVTLTASGAAADITVDSGASLDTSGGSTLTVGGWLLDWGGVYLDTNNGDGGASVTLGGALINWANFYIGNGNLDSATKVTAASLDNNGTLRVQGNTGASAGAAGLATLDVTGAADSVVRGYQQIAGDADLEYGSGAVTSVGSGATLELDGAHAKVTTGGTTTSALTDLAVNRGTLMLRGDGGNGAGGAFLATAVGLDNAGTFSVDAAYGGDGGSTVSIGGTLVNGGTTYIGNTDLSAGATVTTKALDNIGSLTVQGNAASGSAEKAKLIVSGAAAATVVGAVRVGGDAVIAFGSGAITSVGYGSSLELDGSAASIITANGASALVQLAANHGTLALRGDSNLGAHGAVLDTKTGFVNSGKLSIDDSYGGDGGSSVAIGGALTNYATLDIGNTYLSANTAVAATALANDGTLSLQGSSADAAKATLAIAGAASATIYATLQVGGRAQLSFGSGAITSVGTSGYLELDGSQASITTAKGASAIAQLATNFGTLVLRGDTNLGAGGATVVTTTGFANLGKTYIDSQYGGDSGSTVTFGGALANYGDLYIGNPYITANTTVSAKSLLDDNTLDLQGSAANGAKDKATLSIAGAAFAAVDDYLRVGGDAQLAFGSGEITSVGAGGWLELDGSQSSITTAGGASALAKLAVNYGTLVLRGGTNLGANGATLATTATPFTNDGTVYVDSLYGGDAGSTATFGGVLTNNGKLVIGNQSMLADATVSATGLVNDGSVTVQGNNTSGSLYLTSLDIAGAAAATVTGYLRVGGAAALQYGSGEIASVSAGAWLELDGSGAQILTQGGNSSALADFAENDGVFALRGNSSLGGGGAGVTTGVGFLNQGTAYVDSLYGGDGGSSLTLGGTLTNNGDFYIGNTGQSGSTSVGADGLVNNGTLTISTGSAVFSKLTVAGAASDSGVLTINTDTELDVTGTNTFTQLDGVTTVDGTLIAKTVDANDGILTFNSAITGGIGAFDIGALGTVIFDAGVAASPRVDFLAKTGTLGLGDAGAFDATIDGFAGNDMIDLYGVKATSLGYTGSTTSGTLTLNGSGGAVASLAFAGDYTKSSFALASDGHGGTLIY